MLAWRTEIERGKTEKQSITMNQIILDTSDDNNFRLIDVMLSNVLLTLHAAETCPQYRQLSIGYVAAWSPTKSCFT